MPVSLSLSAECVKLLGPVVQVLALGLLKCCSVQCDSIRGNGPAQYMYICYVYTGTHIYVYAGVGSAQELLEVV